MTARGFATRRRTMAKKSKIEDAIKSVTDELDNLATMPIERSLYIEALEEISAYVQTSIDASRDEQLAEETARSKR